MVDAVITVPVWMGMAQRQAIMDAARLGGLNVLGLVNTHAAAALQFGIERDFAKKEQTVSGSAAGCSSDQAQPLAAPLAAPLQWQQAVGHSG